MRPGAHVSGFAAWYIANVLSGPLAATLKQHDGQIHPARLAEVRETWALIKQMGDDWAAEQPRTAASGNAATQLATTPAPSAHEITTDQAADMLGLKPRRVRQLLQLGVLTGRKTGQVWLAERSSVVLHQQTRSEAA